MGKLRQPFRVTPVAAEKRREVAIPAPTSETPNVMVSRSSFTECAYSRIKINARIASTATETTTKLMKIGPFVWNDHPSLSLRMLRQSELYSQSATNVNEGIKE
jgi:hypothetical protein